MLTRHCTRADAGPETQADKPTAAHGFTGETPLLAGVDYIATATVVGPTRIVRYTGEDFLEMMVRCPAVCRVLLPVLAWRIHASAAQAGQRATIDALGTMAAGLAHELNHPAAAVVRAADGLGTALGELRTRTGTWAAVAERGLDVDWLAALAARLPRPVARAGAGTAGRHDGRAHPARRRR